MAELNEYGEIVGTGPGVVREPVAAATEGRPIPQNPANGMEKTYGGPSSKVDWAAQTKEAREFQEGILEAARRAGAGLGSFGELLKMAAEAGKAM